ncbi:hypothetical protein I7I48_08059 [Histoplasma ohiense]|nr:hypothetical protein I7I48_08059 [Histoplasma ohiense (nom. inval.)]
MAGMDSGGEPRQARAHFGLMLPPCAADTNTKPAGTQWQAGAIGISSLSSHRLPPSDNSPPSSRSNSLCRG